MKTKDFYKIAEKETISIINDNIGIDYAYWFKPDLKAILMRNSYITDRAEKRIIAETIAHYYMDSYDYDKSREYTRNEYRAKIRVIQYLIPYNKLIQYKYLSKYEIAEELDVDLDLIEFAFDYYSNIAQ